MSKLERYRVGIDIGTTKVCALVGERGESGSVDIVGVGTSRSRGLRKGAIVNLEETVAAIKRAVEEAELMSGVSVDSAYIGIASTHVKGFNSRGSVTVGGKNREIVGEDIRRVLEGAKAVPLPFDREILHLLPQSFTVDNQEGIEDPLGMCGSRLEVDVHVVTAASAAIQNLVTAVNRCGMAAAGTVLQPYAAGLACLTPDERELGVLLLDIGGGSTDLVIFESRYLRQIAVVPIGGEHFTNDIAVGLRTPLAEAEAIKLKHGTVLEAALGEEDTLEVPGIGGRQPSLIAKKNLCEIIRPRAEEIFELARREVRRSGYEGGLNSGAVLTGGGGVLDGLTEVAEQILQLPVRVGPPVAVGGLLDLVNNPAYATAVGLVLYGFSSNRSKVLQRYMQESGGTLKRMRDLWRDLIGGGN